MILQTSPFHYRRSSSNRLICSYVKTRNGAIKFGCGWTTNDRFCFILDVIYYNEYKKNMQS